MMRFFKSAPPFVLLLAPLLQEPGNECLDRREDDQDDDRAEAEAEARPVDQLVEHRSTTDEADDEPDCYPVVMTGLGQHDRDPHRNGEDRDASEEGEQRPEVSEEAGERCSVLIPAPVGLSLEAGRESDREEDGGQDGVKYEQHHESDDARTTKQVFEHFYILQFLPMESCASAHIKYAFPQLLSLGWSGAARQLTI